MKVKNKNTQDEEILVRDVIDKTNVDYEDEGDKGKGGNKNEEDEEKEEDGRENEVTNDVEVEDIKIHTIQDVTGKQIANNSNDRDNMEEKCWEREMQPSDGDRNYDDSKKTEGSDDDNHWCIKPSGPQYQDPNDEIKLSVIKKVFLTRLKKSSSVTLPTENTIDKKNECRKKPLMESIGFENHKDQDNHRHKRLRKEQYAHTNKQLEGKEHSYNFKKSDEKKGPKHSYLNETREQNIEKRTSNDLYKGEKDYFTANYLKAPHHETSEFGQLKRKFLEDDARQSLTKKTKYDEHHVKLLLHGTVSETYGKFKSGAKIENEFADSQKRTLKYNEANSKKKEENENYLDKKQHVKHQWVINSPSPSTSNRCSSKHEATRLVLKKLKSKSNERYKTHTHDSSTKHDKKEKYNVQRATNKLLANRPKKTKVAVQDNIGKGSKHTIRSNCTTTVATQKLDKKAHLDQSRTARKVGHESVSSKSTRSLGCNGSGRSISKPTETKTSDTPKRTNTIWTLDNFLLQGKPENEHASMNLTINPINHDESSSRTKTAHNLKLICPETKITEPIPSKIHRDAHIQSIIPCKVTVKDCTQTSFSRETSNKSSRTIPAANIPNRKKPLNDLKSNKIISNHFKTTDDSSNHLKKTWNLKEHNNSSGKPQTRQTILSTSKNVKYNKNTEQIKCSKTLGNECYQNPSLKVSIRLSALSGEWLEHNIMRTYIPTIDQTSSYAKKIYLKHKKSTSSNVSVDLSKQSHETDVVPYSVTDQFNKQAKKSKLRIKKHESSVVSHLNHSKDKQQREIISHDADSIKSKNYEETKISGAFSAIATQKGNTDDKKIPQDQPKKKCHLIRKSTVSNDNCRNCKRTEFQSGNKTNSVRCISNARRGTGVLSNTWHRLSGHSHKLRTILLSHMLEEMESHRKLTRVLHTWCKATNKPEMAIMSNAVKKRKKIKNILKNEMKTCRSEVEFADKEDMTYPKGIKNPQNVANGRSDGESDKMAISEKREKLGLRWGFIEVNGNIETGDVGPHATFKMMNDQSGTINDRTVQKSSRLPLPSSTQVDECKGSPIKYQEIRENHNLSRKNIANTITNRTRTINMSLLNHCNKGETCDRFELNHLVKDNMSCERCFVNINQVDINETVFEVENNDNTLKAVDQAATSVLVSKTGAQCNLMCSYMKCHANDVHNTNTPMKYFINDFNLSTYKDLSSISFPVIIHNIEHLTSVSNYILQQLSQERTHNIYSLLKKNKIFSDIQTDQCPLLSREKVLNNFVEPFCELNKKIAVRVNNDDSNHDTFKPKLIFNRSPSFQNLDSLENDESQLQSSVANIMNFSLLLKGMRDQFLDKADREEVVRAEVKEKEEPELFSYSGLRYKALQQNCVNKENTNSNLIKAGYESGGDRPFVFSTGVNFDSYQEHPEQTTANPKMDPQTDKNHDLFELDEETTRLPFKHICHGSDIGGTEKTHYSNSLEIKNLTFTKNQLNQDKFHDFPLVSKYFPEKIKEESVVSTVLSLQKINIEEVDKTTTIGEIASEHLDYYDNRSNFENKRSEAEIIDLTSDEFDEKQCSAIVTENIETNERTKACIKYSYLQPKLNFKLENTSQREVILQTVSKSDLQEENNNDDDDDDGDDDDNDDILVLDGGGSKSQYEDKSVHVNNGISFCDEDTILYVPNGCEENTVKDNSTVNYTTKLTSSNSFKNSQQDQDTLMGGNYALEEKQNECDSTMEDTMKGTVDEFQHEIQKVKWDLFKSWSLVFDSRITRLCSKMSGLLLNKIREELDCDSLTSNECEYNKNNCQRSKQNEKDSSSKTMFRRTNLFWQYFYDFYNTICSKQIDDKYHKFLLIVWFIKVTNKLKKLSKQKYPLSLAKQCMVKLFPQFSFEIPNVAYFLREDGETLRRDCNVVRKALREFKCRRVNTSHTIKNNQLITSTKAVPMNPWFLEQIDKDTTTENYGLEVKEFDPIHHLKRKLIDVESRRERNVFFSKLAINRPLSIIDLSID